MVSVIIPCYNAQETIASALDSVLSQTYEKYEIVIVDDGSTDNSRQIIQNYTENNSQVDIVYIHQVNSGPSQARNKGVQKAKGEFIAFLDADDEWHPEKLKIQVQYLKEKRLNFLGSRYQYIDFEKNMGSIFLKQYTLKELLLKTRFSTPGVIMQKKFFDELGGFDISLKYAEDHDLWLRAAKQQALHIIDEPRLVKLSKPAYGSQGLSSHMSRMFIGELKVLKKLYKDKTLNVLEYVFFNSFVLLKFLRRIMIQKVRR